MCGGASPPPPDPPPVQKTERDAKGQGLRASQRRARRRAKSGFESTILTSPLGAGGDLTSKASLGS